MSFGAFEFGETFPSLLATFRSGNECDLLTYRNHSCACLCQMPFGNTEYTRRDGSYKVLSNFRLRRLSILKIERWRMDLGLEYELPFKELWSGHTR